jgi:hypothetical protein
MEFTTVTTHWAEIFIAGDLDSARRVCRRYCYNVGLCVTIEPVDYVYTGGAESGVRVGLINYPRFPVTREALLETAKTLALLLMDDLHQHSFTIVTPTETFWASRRAA